MLSTKPPVSLTNFRRTFESPLSIDKPHKTFNLKPKGADMWKNAAKQLVSSRKIGRFSTFSTKTVVGGNIKSSELVKPENFGFSAMGCRRKMMCSGVLGSDGVMGLGRTHPRSYTSVAKAVVASSTDNAVEEIQGLLTEMSKEDEKGGGEIKVVSERRRQAWMMRGRKYKEQVRIETEAWDQAAKEYKELLDDMCAQKLAPNLPYMKTLFLGWFEPLRSAIEEDQELWRQGKNMGSYAPYIDQLPAYMMAVITMHKLMGLLMTGGENGCAKVVQAAVEQELLESFQQSSLQ